MPYRSDEVLQELSTNPGTNQLLLYLSASAMQCDSSQRTIVFVFCFIVGRLRPRRRKLAKKRQQRWTDTL